MELSCEDVQGDDICTEEIAQLIEVAPLELNLDIRMDQKGTKLRVSNLVRDVEDLQGKLLKAKTLLTSADVKQRGVLKELLDLLEALMSSILEMKSDVLEMTEDVKSMMLKREDAETFPICSDSPQSPADMEETDDTPEGFVESLISSDTGGGQILSVEQNADNTCLTRLSGSSRGNGVEQNADNTCLTRLSGSSTGNGVEQNADNTCLTRLLGSSTGNGMEQNADNTCLTRLSGSSRGNGVEQNADNTCLTRLLGSSRGNGVEQNADNTCLTRLLGSSRGNGVEQNADNTCLTRLLGSSRGNGVEQNADNTCLTRLLGSSRGNGPQEKQQSEQFVASEALITLPEPPEITAREQQTQSPTVCGKQAKSPVNLLHKGSVQNGFSCKRCPMAFGDSKDLKKHMLTHRVKAFRCDLCNSVQKSEQQIRKHIKAHMGLTPKVEDYTCSVCGKTFKHPKWLLTCKHNVHRRRMDELDEDGETSYSCKVCGKSFPRIRNLKEHEKRHNRSPMFCQLCGKTFLKLRNLKSHVAKHEFDSDGKPFKCKACNRVLLTEMLLRRHKCWEMMYELDRSHCSKCIQGFPSYLNRHKEWQLMQETGLHVKCQVCNKIFNSKSYLEKHVNLHACKTPFSCESCYKSFFLYPSTNSHKKKAVYSCAICKETFQSKYTRNTHYLKHSPEERASHNVVIEKVKCDICGKVSREENMKKHMETHLTDKTYRCKVCGEVMPDVAYMRSQHRLLHPGPFKCDACPRVFKRYKDFSLHQSTHTGEEPFKCSYCGKGFISRIFLQTHEYVHTGMKCFYCEICGKGLSNSFSLKSHLMIHTGEKPFKCDRCPKTFRIKAAMQMHRKIHAKEKSSQALTQ